MRAGSPFLLDELEMARFLKLLRTADRGRVGWSPALATALGKAIFPHAMEFWAALAPMTRRGDGWVSLAVPTAARCWPEGAEKTADNRFRIGKVADHTSAFETPDELRVEVLSGGWEDANSARAGFAYAAGAASRVWRRPDDPCGPFDGGGRLLALIGGAVLLERQAARGDVVDGPGGNPDADNTCTPTPAARAGVLEEAVTAARATGITGDDIRLLGALAQHLRPRVTAAAAELGEEGAAVAELVTACDRVADFLLEDRAERIAALLDAAATANERHAAVFDLTEERRRRDHRLDDDVPPSAA